MRFLRVLICTFLFLVFSSSAYPHGGGLDSYGCHHDRKQGGYHCHRGQFAGQSFGSQGEMLKQLKPDERHEKAIGTTPTGKTIYEGPRGGQYHYSKSGKKVYERRK